MRLLPVFFIAATVIGLSVNPALAASQSLPPSQDELNKVLDQVKKPFKSVFNGITGKSFTQTGTHWEATGTSKHGQKVTIVVYKQIDTKEIRNAEKIRDLISKGEEIPDEELEKQSKKGIVNVAFTTKEARLGNLFGFAKKGDFGKIKIKNATTFIISPNSPLGAKQGAVELDGLPEPLAKALRAINPKMEEVSLPTGIFTINQFVPGQSDFIEHLFKEVGISYPVTSSMRMNAGNYKNLIEGKVGLSLSIHLTKNNMFARLMESTTLFEVPSDATSVLTLSASAGKGGVGKVGIALKQPYLVMGAGPLDTAANFSYEAGKSKLTAEMSVGVGKLVNPVIVPKILELNGVTMDDTSVTIGFETSPENGVEVSAGLEIGKFTAKGTTFEPVTLQLAMGKSGPTGGLIKIKSTNTIYLDNVVDLAEVAINANQHAKGVPSWARGDISKALQLDKDKLPKIGLRNAELFIATPGQDDSNHLADFFDIAGAGVRVKGELEAYGHRLTHTELTLDIINGLNAVSYVKPFKKGVFEIKGADLTIHASFKAIPYFKLHGGAAINGTTVGEMELMLGRKGIKVLVDQGCFPYMLKIDVETNGWDSIKSGGVGPSDCAGELAQKALDAAKEVGKKIGETAGKAAADIDKGAKEAAKWASGAVNDAKQFAEKAGCDIADFFSGGKCSSEKAKKKKRELARKREKALEGMANYRKQPNAGNCGDGWYWNHGYRRCFPLGDYKMVYYARDGAKNGRCLTIKDGQNKNGQSMVFWDCVGQWNQVFKTEPWNPKDKNSKAVKIVNSAGRCVSVDPKLDKGAPVVLWRCDKKAPGQRWEHIGSRLVGNKGLCLVAKGPNKNGGNLVLGDCSANVNPKKPPVEWVYSYPSPNRGKDFFKALGAPPRSQLVAASKGGLCADTWNNLLPETKTYLLNCSKKEWDQAFSLVPVGKNAQFALLNRHSRLCLGVKNKKETPILSGLCNYSSGQLWQAVSPGGKYTDKNTFKGKFMLKNMHSGMCITPMAFIQDYSPQGKRELAQMSKKDRDYCLTGKDTSSFGSGVHRICPLKQVQLVEKVSKKAFFLQKACNGKAPQLFKWKAKARQVSSDGGGMLFNSSGARKRQ